MPFKKGDIVMFYSKVYGRFIVKIIEKVKETHHTYYYRHKLLFFDKGYNTGVDRPYKVGEEYSHSLPDEEFELVIS